MVKLRVYVCTECLEATKESDMEHIKTIALNYKYQCPNCSNETFTVYTDKKY